MPTPQPTWDPGQLEKDQMGLIEIPGWITNMIEQNARNFTEQSFREGWREGFNVSSDNYTKTDILRAVTYILNSNGANDDEIQVAIAALKSSLPERLGGTYSP